jgi:hypothetical protein
MPKYLLLQRSPVGGEPPSPARMQEMFAVWNAWKEKFKDNIVDMGAKLKPGGRVVSSAGAMDGPFVEAKEIVGGYMIITADNYDRAVEAATEMMGMMMPGAGIEVREMAGP